VVHVSIMIFFFPLVSTFKALYISKRQTRATVTMRWTTFLPDVISSSHAVWLCRTAEPPSESHWHSSGGILVPWLHHPCLARQDEIYCLLQTTSTCSRCIAS
jgi:hypothetical protein